MRCRTFPACPTARTGLRPQPPCPQPLRPRVPPTRATAAHREALRPPLEKILREGTALLGCALPPAVRQHAENLRSAADELARVLDNPGALAQAPAGPPARTAFNLQHLVREAHDAVSVAAENAGIGLAWYLPPLLGHMYEGPGQALRQVLDGLLESAVRATAHGAVHLTVRRVPESADPGHLLFTVTDTARACRRAAVRAKPCSAPGSWPASATVTLLWTAGRRARPLPLPCASRPWKRRKKRRPLRPPPQWQ